MSQELSLPHSYDHLMEARRKCQEGDYGGGMQDCKKALEITPNNSLAYRQLGMAHYLLGDLDQAETCWKKAWELEWRK